MLFVGGVLLFMGGPDPSPGCMASAQSGGFLYILGGLSVIGIAIGMFIFGRKSFL